MDPRLLSLMDDAINETHITYIYILYLTNA